ncbi:MAG: fasciclin domain-containing protein [Flavisolibacter sp.]
MKLKAFKNYFFLITTVAVICVAGCTKSDNYYKNYTTTAGNFSGDALEYLQSQPGVYDSMLLAINRITGLADTLRSEEITVFAVSNRSFTVALQNINQARLDSIPSMPPVFISTIDSATLDTFLCRYILRGHATSDSLINFTDGRLYPSIRYSYPMQMQYSQTNASGFKNGGPKAITFSDPKNSIFTRYWVRVNTITVDIKTSNAIVHLLPPNHDFGFGDDFIRSVNRR